MAFARLQDAVQYAREASARFRVAFFVYRFLGGRLALVERLSPGPHPGLRFGGGRRDQARPSAPGGRG
jgi:hypothetical protein